jgi:hypothetical protein
MLLYIKTLSIITSGTFEDPNTDEDLFMSYLHGAVCTVSLSVSGPKTPKAARRRKHLRRIDGELMGAARARGVKHHR